MKSNDKYLKPNENNDFYESMTKEERRSSLEEPFWNPNQKVDKNSKLYKEIEEVCKGVFDDKKISTY